MISEAEGDVEVVDGVLVIKRIRVRYRLEACPEDKREAAERAHRAHAAHCPVAKTIGGCVDITTDLQYV